MQTTIYTIIRPSIIILYLLYSLNSTSQIIAPAPYYIEITENQTSHLIFESDISYIDVGDNNNFVADYTNSILRIKGKKNALTTNLTVVTKDMNYYSFLVKYAVQPKLNYFIKQSESLNNIGLKSAAQKSQKEVALNSTTSIKNTNASAIEQEVVASSNQNDQAKQSVASSHSRKSEPVSNINQAKKSNPIQKKAQKTIPKVLPNKSHIKGKSIEDLEKITPQEKRDIQTVRRLAQFALTDTPLYTNIQGKHGDIILQVTGVYHSLHNCYIKYEIENTGEIPYDIDYIEFGMREKKRPKRTALNDKIFAPINILNGDITRVLPYRKNRYVAILEKVAVPEGRVLYLEIVENGRNIPLKIPYNKIKKQFIQ